MSKERSRKGPMPEGGGLVPTRTHRRGAHRDLTSDRGHRQGETGGATALTRASSGTRMTSLGHPRRRQRLVLAQHPLSLYKILVYLKVLWWESIILLLPPPLLQNLPYCNTIARPLRTVRPPTDPPPPPLECHASYNICDVNIVKRLSCGWCTSRSGARSPL